MNEARNIRATAVLLRQRSGGRYTINRRLLSHECSSQNGAGRFSHQAFLLLSTTNNRDCGRYVYSLCCQRNEVNKRTTPDLKTSVFSIYAPVLRSAGTKYFFLSMSGMSLRSAFSQITCKSNQIKRQRTSQPQGRRGRGSLKNVEQRPKQKIAVSTGNSSCWTEASLFANYCTLP